MDRMMPRRRMDEDRTRRLSRILAVVAAVVMFAGLFAQIAMRAQVSGQAKELAAIEQRIHTLNANAENLNSYINDYHNLTAIGERALELGMQQPGEDQLRVIHIPALQDTAEQTVAIGGGEQTAG